MPGPNPRLIASDVLDLGVVATVLGLVFVAELPDKTAVAGLVLGARFPARWVFAGIAAAFLVHVVIAVAAGSLLSLLPRRPVEVVVAVLFLVGAVLIWREGLETEEERDEAAADAVPATAGFARVAALGFGVIFLAEWGDLTQILTANLAAKYHDPLSVGLGDHPDRRRRDGGVVGLLRRRGRPGLSRPGYRGPNWRSPASPSPGTM
jgi:putative Ca2+/H+ antiporter (TMEM165/GDT1 family)